MVSDDRMKKWKIIVPSILIILSLFISYIYNAFEVGVSFSFTVFLIAIYYRLRKKTRKKREKLQEKIDETELPPALKSEESKEKNE